MKVEFPKFIRVVEVSYLDFDKRDLIYVKKFKDFLFIAGDDDKRTLVIYKKRNSFYLLSSDSVWVYEYKDVRK